MQMWKFNINPEWGNKFEFTEAFVEDGPIHVGEAFDAPFLWAAVDTSGRTAKWTRVFHVFGTGHNIPDGLKFVGTAVCGRGRLVWHVFTVE